jgi:hypothetical protein
MFKIWESGFSVSQSLAEGALNGDQINATIYYILSNQRAPYYEVNQNASFNLRKFDLSSQRCYEGFSNLYATKLWRLPKNEDELYNLVSIWTLTLDRFGCRNFLELGVTGILQAILLSLGSLKFTNHHLELNLNPRQLHRDYLFRKVNYLNESLLTIEVQVDSENHANLFVTLDKLIEPSKRFFVCDAGCIDSPLELKL